MAYPAGLDSFTNPHPTDPTNAPSLSGILTALNTAVAALETTVGITGAFAFLPTTGGSLTGAVAMGSHKITGLSNGTASSDAAAFGQIPTALPPNGAAGGDLTGSFPNPTLTGTANVQGIVRTYRAALTGDVTASQDSNATTLVGTSAVQAVIRTYRAALTGDVTAAQDSNATSLANTAPVQAVVSQNAFLTIYQAQTFL